MEISRDIETVRVALILSNEEATLLHALVNSSVSAGGTGRAARFKHMFCGAVCNYITSLYSARTPQSARWELESYATIIRPNGD